MAVVVPTRSNHITMYQVDQELRTVKQYQAQVLASSQDEAQELLNEFVQGCFHTGSIDGRVIKGWGLTMIHASHKPVLTWFMDIITGASSPREYWFRIDIHLQRLGTN